MNIIISNTFHGTVARVSNPILSARTVARVRRTLCGIAGCNCGGNLGERGDGKRAICDEAGREYRAETQANGSIRLVRAS